MSSPKPSDVQTMQDVAGLFKGGMSTAKIYRTLFRLGQKVPRNVSDSDPVFSQAVALKAENGVAIGKLQTGKSEIEAVSNDIKAYISKLGEFKSTVTLKDAFENEYGTKSNKISSLVAERDTLLTDFQNLIKTQDEKVTAILTRLSGNQISPQQARTEIQELRREQDKITLATAKLVTAEKSLHAELNDMHKRVKAAADIVAPPQPATPPQATKKLGM